jgi:hypothetical protein
MQSFFYTKSSTTYSKKAVLLFISKTAFKLSRAITLSFTFFTHYNNQCKACNCGYYCQRTK